MINNIIPNILKSPNDDRECYTYELPNKLRVFILHDDNVDLSCAAMLVKVGYHRDTIPGIAHFLEHMLFNGTEQFPGENEFSSYISKHNGYHNAYTTHDHTCYHFTVAEDGLLHALKNFGDFFVAPLLKKDCVDREKDAVHSEHMKNVNDDSWRAHELLRVAANGNHLFKNFGTGSNETLNIKDIDIHVRNFFEKNYSSDKMTLVIILKNKIENVKQEIDKIFGKIQLRRTHNIESNEKILDTPKLIKFLPIEDKECISLTWEIPFNKNNPNESSLEFLIYLISNETKNSIHYILSRKGYAIEFDCGIRDVISSKCLFSINIKLSPHGKNFIHEMVGTIMNYFELLKKNINSDALEKIYNDHLKLILYKFKHFEKENSMDTALNICLLINDYCINPKNIFVVNILQDYYSNNIKLNLKQLLDHMTLDNLVLIAGSKDYKNDKMNKFPHYGTEYTIDNLKINYTKIIGNPQLPEINPFISIASDISASTAKNPFLISNKIQSYCFPNIKYNTPDVCIICKLNLQISTKDVYLSTCILLYLNALFTEINPGVYLCNNAMYNLSMLYKMGDIYLKISGNYDKIYEVCKYLLDNMLNGDIITDQSYETSKYALMHEDENFIYSPPYIKIEEYFSKITSKYYYDSSDRLKIIERITKKDVIKVFNKLFSYNNISLIMSGNCDKNLCSKINSLFETLSSQNKNSNYDLKQKFLYEIPQQSKKYRIMNEYPEEENVSVGFHIYIDTCTFKNNIQWARVICLSNLLHNLMSTVYFDQLRTQESFGYIVKGKLVTLDNVKRSHYYLFLVQSPHKTVDEITNRTSKFIESYGLQLKNMNQADFETTKKSFITTIKTDFNNLLEQTSFIFLYEIETQYLQFNYKQVLIDECEKITLQDLIAFYFDKFINNRIEIIIELDKQRQSNDMKGGKYNFENKLNQCMKHCMKPIKLKKMK
jgi:insulysin